MKTKILDLIDFEKVNTLLEGFNQSTGFVTAILDLEGNVLSQSGWRQICTQFHRIHPETAKKCTISDTMLAGELGKGEKYHFYKCLNGLVDVAVPIVIKGEHIANLFSGQFFFEKPDPSFFQKQAAKYGFNQEIYLKALGDVPIIPEEKVKTAMDFLQNMTQLISEMTFQKLEQMELNEAMQKNERILRLFIENSPASIAMFDNNMCYLVASRRFLSDYNLGNQEVIGLSHYEAFPEISERWKNFHRRGLAGETLKEDKDPFPRADGKTDWVRWEIRPWYESDDRIGGIILFSEVITAQIEDREALKESEKYNRMLFEQSAIGLLLTSLDGKLIDINLTCANIIGRTIEEAKELTYWNITPEKYLDQEQQQLKNLDKIGYYGPYEKEYIHKDGHLVPVRLQGLIIERNNEKYIWSSVEDITVRKLAEEALRKSEQEFRSMAESMPQIVWITRADGWNIYFNHQWVDYTGLTLEESYGHGWNTPFHPDDKQRAWDAWQNAVNNNGIYSIEARLRRFDGEYRWWLVRGVPQLSESGEILKWFGTCTDIGEIKKAEEAMHLSEEYFKNIFEYSTVGKSITEIGGKIKTNKTFRQILGYSDEEFLDVNWQEITHPDDIGKDKEYVRSLIAGEYTSRRWEKRYIHKDGHPVWVDISTVLQRDTENKPLFFITSIQDISERIQAEEKLRTSEAKFRAVAELSPMAIYSSIGSDQKAAYINKAFYKIFGFSVEDVPTVGDWWIKAFPDEKYRQQVIDKWVYNIEQADKNNKDVETLECVCTCKDGSEKIITWTGKTIGDEFWAFGYDLTERIQAEKALHESERLLRESQAIARLGSFVWDLSTGLWKSSEILDEIFGIDENYIRSLEGWANIVHPDWQKMMTEYVANEVVGKFQKFDKEYKIIRQNDSQELWVHGLAILEFDSNNMPIKLIGTISDITERKQAEENLRRSEEDYRKLFEDHAAVKLIIDPSTANIYDANYAAAQYYGWPREELRKMNLKQINVLSADEIQVDIQQSKVHKKNNFEFKHLKADGSIRDVEVFSNSISMEGKEFVHAIVMDITERKQAEDDLHKHSSRLKNLHMIDQAILQAIESPEAVVQTAIQHIRELLDCQRVSVGIFDLEKKEVLVYAADIDGKTIVQVGKVLTEEMYGVIDTLRQSKMEIVEDMSMVASPSLVNLILQAEGIQSSINVALVSELEMYGVLNVGWEKSKTISAEETDIAGEVANQITIAIEKARLLKETKVYASELEHRVIQRTEQLEAANKELEAFSYSVSHDLRAPLRHISGFSEMLSKDIQKQLPEKDRHYLDIINSSAQKMGNLIDDLLIFSRTGRAEMKKSSFNMNQVIEDAVSQVKSSTADRQIDWNIANLPEVFADYNLVRLVWVNLLDNAIKYTRTRKKTIIQINCKEEPKEYVFSIRDNGVGFDMQYASKLFGVFQRLHSTAEFEGTGIGLANIRRIILKHGGRTWAEAKLNKGATFYFTLPKNKENNL